MVLVQAPFTYAVSHIVRDEDWTSPLPRVTQAGVPYDLTGVTLEIYVRTVHGQTGVLIRKFSTATGEIVLTDPTGGQAHMSVTHANVVSFFPEDGEFEHFCRMIEAGVNIELFRGPFYVHPGQVTAY